MRKFHPHSSYHANFEKNVFDLGMENVAFAQYFIGKSYLNMLTGKDAAISMSNVTFEPGCRNNWHIHWAKTGGGQILICIAGEGWYQEEGKEAVSLKPGTIINMRRVLADMNDVQARGNLMWDSAMAENGILKVGRLTDFQAHQIEHQLGAYTDCNHGQGLAVIQPVYYRHILKDKYGGCCYSPDSQSILA